MGVPLTDLQFFSEFDVDKSLFALVIFLKCKLESNLYIGSTYNVLRPKYFFPQILKHVFLVQRFL